MNEFQLALIKDDKKAKSAEKSAQGWGQHWVISAAARTWSSWSQLVQRPGSVTNREEDEPERADYAEVWRGPDGEEIERRPESDEEADYIAEWVKEIEVDSDEDWEEPCSRRLLFWRP